MKNLNEKYCGIIKGIVFTIFAISVTLNIHTYQNQGFEFGKKNNVEFSGVGYDKKAAEDMLNLVDATMVKNKKGY